MLTALQLTLLQIAATKPANTEGSISHIMLGAAAVGDWDTMLYIYSNYLSTEHFTQQQINELRDIYAQCFVPSQMH